MPLLEQQMDTPMYSLTNDNRIIHAITSWIYCLEVKKFSAALEYAHVRNTLFYKFCAYFRFKYAKCWRSSILISPRRFTFYLYICPCRHSCRFDLWLYPILNTRCCKKIQVWPTFPSIGKLRAPDFLWEVNWSPIRNQY